MNIITRAIIASVAFMLVAQQATAAAATATQHSVTIDNTKPRLAAATATQHSVTIDNTKPRLDTHGNIINAHDGTIKRFGGYWYYHAAEYALCHEPAKHGCDQTADHCGFHPNHNVSIWRSPDLSSGSWEFRGHAMRCAELPGCKVMYRPHLVFNPTTREYVLFVNVVGKTMYMGYSTSDFCSTLFSECTALHSC